MELQKAEDELAKGDADREHGRELDKTAYIRCDRIRTQVDRTLTVTGWIGDGARVEVQREGSAPGAAKLTADGCVAGRYTSYGVERQQFTGR